jgi:hypothetical protein
MKNKMHKYLFWSGAAVGVGLYSFIVYTVPSSSRTIVLSIASPVLTIALIGLYTFLRDLEKVENKKNEAENNYFAVLDQIQENPNNPDLHVKALELGRKYYLLRSQNFSGSYLSTRVASIEADEARIRSDIDARIGNRKTA